jgi:hypothetical protein
MQNREEGFEASDVKGRNVLWKAFVEFLLPVPVPVSSTCTVPVGLGEWSQVADAVALRRGGGWRVRCRVATNNATDKGVPVSYVHTCVYSYVLVPVRRLGRVWRVRVEDRWQTQEIK